VTERTSNGHRTIVVPLDGSELSERALPLARAFLSKGGELVVVQVAPSEGALSELAAADLLTPAELDGDDRAESRSALRRVVERLRGEGAAARELLVEGDPVHEICRVAAELDASLIVMATHGRGALQRLTHGSVADGVSRRAATPVLLVRVRDGAGSGVPAADIRRLLVPYDGSEVAAQALPVAVAHAKALGVPVLLVRAVNPAAEMPGAFGPAGGGDPSSAILYGEILDDEQDAATESLAALTSDLGKAGVSVSSQVVVGSAVTAVEELSEPGDVVVMASHGRSGIGRWLLGSVAEKLVREGKAPVLLVPAADRVAAHEAAGA